MVGRDTRDKVLRVVFVGTVEFSLKSLEKLIDLGADVVGVCTKEESKFNSDYADLSPVCVRNGIPYKFVSDINSKESIEWFRSLRPDVIFCFGWSSLIKKELLNLPDFGVVGFHPSLLPMNRGRHPIIWALALGLDKTGSTFFVMDEDADSGDILSQAEVCISIDDDAGTLYEKIIESGLKQLEDFFPKMIEGSCCLIKQDDSQFNTWRKRGEKDGKIDFRMTTRAIYNLIRALTHPYIGAHVVYKSRNICIWKASEIQNEFNNCEPGKILKVSSEGVLVKTYDAAILLEGHEFEQLPEVGGYL